MFPLKWLILLKESTIVKDNTRFRTQLGWSTCIHIAKRYLNVITAG